MKRFNTVDGGRFYLDDEEMPHYSVTEILDGALPKQHALMPWAAAEAAMCAVRHYDSIGRSLERGYTSAVIRFIKTAYERKRDKAADLGSLIHRATECWLTEQPMPPWPAECDPYMDAFVDFLITEEPVVVAAEMTVFNRTQRYAGRLDLILRLPNLHNITVLVDTKTGKNVYGDQVALQLAAYRHAETYMVDGDERRPMPHVDGCAVLHLRADGTYRFRPVRTDREVFDHFLHARENYRWIKETSRGVLGENRQDGSVGVIGKGIKRTKAGDVPTRVLDAWLPDYPDAPWREPEVAA